LGGSSLRNPVKGTTLASGSPKSGEFEQEEHQLNFGIALPTPADPWKTVKRAEDAGFSTAWFRDPELWVPIF
jgi:hypothetical protein